MDQTDQPVTGRTETPAAQLLETFRSIERWPLADIAFYQAGLLEMLVRHCREAAPFYRERFKAAFGKDDVLEMDRWREVPILTPEEARAAGDALHAHNVPPEAGKSAADRTTGSTGEPLRFRRSDAARLADSANSLRIFRDHAFNPDLRFADVRIAPRGKGRYPEGELRRAWSHGDGHGDYAILDIRTPLADQVEWLVRMQPSILFTWASNLRALALAFEQRGETLPVGRLASSAEASTDEMRRDSARVFGTVPVDIFGAREIGVIAWRCHEGPYYHLAVESALLEILRDDGDPARPGETGRLVATALYSLHTPFVRYATGDYLTLATERCPCGRTLPAVSAIRGRDRNRMRRRGGGKVFPEIPEAALDRLFGPLCWQIVQETLEGFAVLVYVADRLGDETTRRAAATVLAPMLGDGATVRVAGTVAPTTKRRRKHELFYSELP